MSHEEQARDAERAFGTRRNMQAEALQKGRRHSAHETERLMSAPPEFADGDVCKWKNEHRMYLPCI
jgi:hypothetical protein